MNMATGLGNIKGKWFVNSPARTHKCWQITHDKSPMFTDIRRTPKSFRYHLYLPLADFLMGPNAQISTFTTIEND